MSLRDLLVAAPLVSLFFFSTFAVAGINVTATCTVDSLFWTFNSLGQSPCTVAAYMLATCYEGSATLAPLPSGYAYKGPSHDFSNKCQCSTVGYSLLSACSACQNRHPLPWSEYVANCTSTSTLPPSQFPNPVPNGTRVPHWAILDVTNENNWNANESYAFGSNPEYGPGAFFGASGVSTSSASASSTSSPTTAPRKGSSSNTGAIVGGVVGGVAVVTSAVAMVFYLRQRSQASSARSTGFDASQPHMDGIPRLLSDGGTFGPSSPSIRTKLSDVPDDQTTFQWSTGPHSVDHPPPGTPGTTSHIGSGSDLANMQTSLPQTRGYHGFPMPSA